MERQEESKVLWNLVPEAGVSFTASSLAPEGLVYCTLSGVCIGDKQRTFETEWFNSHRIAVRCPEPPRIGERIVAFVDVLGRLEGRVSARMPQGFRLDLNMSESDRTTFQELIALLKSRVAAGLPRGRRHERVVPVRRKVIVVDSAGGSCSGRLIDVSRSGAAVKVDGKFEVGDMVRLGERTHGKVVRLIEKGIAVQFLNPIPFEEFAERALIALAVGMDRRRLRL